MVGGLQISEALLPDSSGSGLLLVSTDEYRFGNGGDVWILK
jgi:hypothetical protein